MNEPIADATRSILDGHIVLSRALAAKNHYPAIDILGSASRVMRGIVSAEHLNLNGQVREIMATYKEAEDLINIGAYVEGSNGKIDYAMGRIEAINQFLRQEMEEKVDLDATLEQMNQLVLDRRQRAR